MSTPHGILDYRRLAICLTLAVLFLSGAAQAQTHLGTTALVESSAAGADSVILTDGSLADVWSATANDAWLHVATGSASGAGSATVVFNFDANTGGMRTGSLTVGGQILSVTQAGVTQAALSGPIPVAPPLFSISSSSNTFAVDSAGNVCFPGANGGIVKWTASTQTAAVLLSSGNWSAIAVDGGGNIYLGTGNPYTGGGTVWKYLVATQQLVPLITSGFTDCAALAVDRNGNVSSLARSPVFCRSRRSAPRAPKLQLRKRAYIRSCSIPRITLRRFRKAPVTRC